MTYATQDDIQQLRRLTPKQLLQLTTDGDTPTADSDVVGTALADASAVVDSYCRQRYQVPLQPSRQIVVVTVDIAVYTLYGGRPLDANAPAAVRYREAMTFLKDVAAGRASLDQADSATDLQLGSGGVVTPSRPQVFTDCNLEGWA